MIPHVDGNNGSEGNTHDSCLFYLTILIDSEPPLTPAHRLCCIQHADRFGAESAKILVNVWGRGNG